LREERKRGSRSPSNFTRRGDRILVPALLKFRKDKNNLVKLSIPSETLTNNFLVMNRQVWTNKERHLSATIA
jgi:hypothetical protein